MDKERQLEDALMLGDPITDLTVAMEIDYFQLNRAEYYVPIIVKIPGRELALAKRFGAEHTVIDFVCEIKDEAGGFTVSNVRDNVDIKLSDATALELAKRPIEYDSGFTLLPGRYSIKFLARDDETGRIGTYQTEFIIPNLNKETTRVPISSVVLSSQRVDTRDALYNATKGKQQTKDDAKNPLVQEGLKLIPSVTRVFSPRARCMCTCRPMMAARPPRLALRSRKTRFTADRVCEPLSGRQKGIRIRAHCRNSGGREPAGHGAVQLSNRPWRPRARRIPVPDQRSRSLRTQGRVLGESHHAGEVTAAAS